MSACIAEQSFWMSRYLERAEDTARILDVNQTRRPDLDAPQWQPFLLINGISDMLHEPEAEAVQNYMTWEWANPNSIARSLAAARENARLLREVIGADVWERMNHYHLWMQGPAARALYAHNRSEFYSEIKRINPLLHGLIDGTTSYGLAWEFFQLGKYLERACQTARILNVKYPLRSTPGEAGAARDDAYWMAILTSCSADEPFVRQLRPVRETGAAVADFLLFDPFFPRSVWHCLAECQKTVHTISGRPLSEPGNDPEHLLADLVDWLRDTDVLEILDVGLHESLTHLVDRMHEIADAVDRTWFLAQGQSLLAATGANGKKRWQGRAQDLRRTAILG